MTKLPLNAILVAAYCAFLPATAIAESSKEYAIMANATWSAFECSSLASENNKPKEQERLFWFGYKQGNKFITAMKAGKIKKKDLDAEVPTIMLLLLEGPTPDFMLGRMFESAQNLALKDVYKDGKHSVSKEARAMAAENKFTASNCHLIGK